MNTTRKHPRTMQEAFNDADYASPLTRTRRGSSMGWPKELGLWLLVLAMLLLTLWMAGAA